MAPREAMATSTRRLRSKDGRSLSDQVYDYLADQIIRGKMGYGDKLNIKRIAAQLEMSSMPIRDAIKRLEQENIVVVKPRSNCYVRMPTKKATLDAIESRRMVETFAVTSIYPHVSQLELSQLRRVLESMRPIASASAAEKDRKRLEEYIELDRQFHTELCSLARNDYIDRFYREISMHLSMSFSYGIGVCHGLESTFAEHEAIVSHLLDHSPMAVTVLKEHLLRSRENIVSESMFQTLPQ